MKNNSNSPNRGWYSIQALAAGAAEIIIYDEIGYFGVTAKDFLDELNALGVVAEISLRINSPGGEVSAGTAIYNALRRNSARITVTIDGLAASMASVVAMAGDVIIMPENALMMIHDPSALVWGTAEDFKKVADVLDKWKSGIVAAYRNKTGLDGAEIETLMAAETWFTAAEAVAKGFADQVEVPVQAAANFDLSRFNHPPANFQMFKGTFPAAAQRGITHGQKENPPMTETVKTPAAENQQPEITADLIAKNHADVADHFRAEGKILGGEEAKARIAAITTADDAAGREDLAAHLAFNTDLSAEDSLKALAATPKVDGEATAKAAFIAAAKADEGDGENPAASIDNAGGVDKNAPIEDRAQVQWDASGDLRAEFGNFERWLAYAKNKEAGHVRLLERKAG